MKISQRKLLGGVLKSQYIGPDDDFGVEKCWWRRWKSTKMFPRYLQAVMVRRKCERLDDSGNPRTGMLTLYLLVNSRFPLIFGDHFMMVLCNLCN